MAGVTYTGEVVEVAEEVFGPSSFAYEQTVADGAASVELAARYREGRYVVEAVRVTGRADAPVTADTLRQVRVAELLREGVRDALGWNPGVYKPPDPGRGPGDEVLESVARVYTLGYLLGDPPKQMVAKTFEIPPDTAARWIMRARAAGYLGETEERRAGI